MIARWIHVMSVALMCGVVLLMPLRLGAAERPWVLDGAEAKSLLDDGASVLDTRDPGAFEAGHLPGAQRISWQTFSRSRGADQGELLADDAVLQARLRLLGISAARPVLVVGDPLHGWGEEGRIVWMLRTLGHERAALVDGGMSAMRDAALDKGAQSTVKTGDFVVKRTARYQVDAEALKEAMADEAHPAVILDAREAREYAGKTPYGESRGGHVPGAVHLHFSSLLDERGYLLPREVITEKLAALGVKDRRTPIIAYCTGGIRSAWVVAVLQDLGYGQARNYAGSMWQWSSRDATSYPLELK